MTEISTDPRQAQGEISKDEMMRRNEEMENYRMALAYIAKQSIDQESRELAQTALDAGQPQTPLDRTEIANAIRRGLVEDWVDDLGAKWNEDVLLTGCRRVGGGRGYAKPEEAAQNLALDAADAVLALSRPDRPASVSDTSQHRQGE